MFESIGIVSPYPKKKQLYILLKDKLYNTCKRHDWNQGRSWHPMMLRLHFSIHGPFNTNSPTKITTGSTSPSKANMSILHIITLLEFCLKTHTSSSKDKYYEQVHGAAMGFPISPLTAILFMEEFEVRALSTTHTPVSG